MPQGVLVNENFNQKQANPHHHLREREGAVLPRKKIVDRAAPFLLHLNHPHYLVSSGHEGRNKYIVQAHMTLFISFQLTPLEAS
jgi:hypothetical protein